MQDLPLLFFSLEFEWEEGVGLLYQAHEAVGSVGHGLDGRVRHGFELGVGEFVLGADVDEGAFVAGAVAIMGGGEDWVRESKVSKSKRFLRQDTAPVMAVFGVFLIQGGGKGIGEWVETHQ